jgi:uncharacterized protein YdhG (YjbR/CyaY superfamily)
MPNRKNAYADIDTYIASFPFDVQSLLQDLRRTIRAAAPNAEETINYAIPTFKLQGSNLVHFAAFSQHIGFYPGASGIAHFKQELSPYHNAKGSVQFPIDQPLPLELINRIVRFKVEENLEIAAMKKSGRKSG